jgi:hypothetical protein
MLSVRAGLVYTYRIIVHSNCISTSCTVVRSMRRRDNASGRRKEAGTGITRICVCVSSYLVVSSRLPL